MIVIATIASISNLVTALYLSLRVEYERKFNFGFKRAFGFDSQNFSDISVSLEREKINYPKLLEVHEK